VLATSELVAEIRKVAGETQEALARRLGVSFPTVNAWERGRSVPRPDHRRKLEELAAQLGITSEISVLVIDDDPTTGSLVDAAAREVDPAITVETALDGWQGLVRCGAVRPALIFLDILMPGIDGIEVARRLPGIQGLGGTEVVFVTSSTDARLLARASELGHPVLSKPLDFDRLADTIAGRLTRT
jgi:CheY-like chemotaxis protein/DNA-binding XRE family transcriptional regulator